MNYQTLVIQRIYSELETHLGTKEAVEFYNRVREEETSQLRPFSKAINGALTTLLDSYNGGDSEDGKRVLWALSTPANGDAVVYWLEDIQTVAIPAMANIRKAYHETNPGNT